MNAMKRGFALICSLLFLLLFCLPIAGGAAESDLTPEEPAAPDTVATAEELTGWLEAHAAAAGAVILTADITLEDLRYYRFPAAAAAEIDTGAFTLKIAGNVELLCAKLTLRGDGGDEGVLHVLEGGTLSVDHLTVEARNGLALVQEEGSGFVGAACLSDEGGARYAETPYIWSFHPALSLVEAGEPVADALPKTVKGSVNRNGGQQGYEDVAVVWSLTGSEPAQEAGVRFTAPGQCDGFASAAAPLCTVVYDGGPLTFTNVTGLERSGGYAIKTDFTKPDRLPIKVVQAYSFDGEHWLDYWTETVSLADDGLSYNFGKGTGEECWDAEHAPYLYLRLHWADGETDRYSNILRFAAASFGEAEDIGGNRGGGTEIPQPDPQPDPEPPHRPTPPLKPKPTVEPKPSPEPTSEPTPVPEPTPEPTSEPTPEQSPEPEPTPEQSPEPTPEPTPSTSPRPTRTPVAVPAVSPRPSPAQPSAPVVEPTGTPQPAPSQEAAVPVEPLPSDPPGPQGPGLAAIAVGVGTTAAAMGGAALWLRPKLHPRSGGKTPKKK